MTDGRQVIKQFLLEHAKDSTHVQEALGIIEPFFCIIEEGKYPLAEESDSLRREAVAVLSAVFGSEKTTVEFLSLNGDPARNGQSLGEYWRKYGMGPVGWNWDLAQQLFFRSFWNPLVQCLGLDPNDDSLLASLGTSLLHEIRSVTWDVVGESLEPHLGSLVALDGTLSRHEQILGSGMGQHNVSSALWADAIQPALLFYLGFVIGADMQHARQLQPLVSLLTKAIPIGKQEEDGDTWLVFVA